MTPEHVAIVALWGLGAVLALAVPDRPKWQTYVFAALWPMFVAFGIIFATLGIEPPDDKG